MRTEIIVVLDRSGSMQTIKTDMEGGFNALIEEQKKNPDPAFVTLVQFDDFSYDKVYESRPLSEVPKLELHPRGMTPLLDAIGRTIVQQGERFDKMTVKPEAVVLVIITDGLENASKEYTRERVMQLIKQQQDEWKWAVTYIGANQDAIAVAAEIGIPISAALTYSANSGGVKGMSVALNAAIGCTRAVGSSYSYSDEDRKNSVAK